MAMSVLCRPIWLNFSMHFLWEQPQFNSDSPLIWADAVLHQNTFNNNQRSSENFSGCLGGVARFGEFGTIWKVFHVGVFLTPLWLHYFFRLGRWKEIWDCVDRLGSSLIYQIFSEGGTLVVFYKKELRSKAKLYPIPALPKDLLQWPFFYSEDYIYNINSNKVDGHFELVHMLLLQKCVRSYKI